MNTQFQKEDKKLATYRRPNFNATPFTRPNYETIDYWLTQNRWKNTIVNIETDPTANITTDHIPMIVTIKTKLRAIKKEARQGRSKYEKCNKEQNEQYNLAIEAEKKRRNNKRRKHKKHNEKSSRRNNPNKKYNNEKRRHVYRVNKANNRKRIINKSR